MSDGTFTRPSRLFEPRTPESRASDPPISDRRGPTSDPLLELARLIGQSDPFAPAQRREQPRGNERGGPDAERAPPMWGRDYPHVQDRSADDRHADQERVDDDRHAVGTPPPRFPIQPDPPDHAAMSAPGGFFRHPSQFEQPAGPAALAPADAEPVDPRAYPDPRAAHYDSALGPNEEYAGEFAETNEYGDEYEYETDSEEEPRDDDGSGLKRRHTTKVVLAVLGLAVFGSAAAFGFRTIFKGGVQGPPPIIRADNSPTKAMPASVPGEAGMKPINERLGDAASERMVRREEEPVELRNPARSGNAGAVMPGAGGPFNAAGGFPPATSTPAATAPASSTEPKRVRTVTIRADQGAVAPERATPLPARAAAPPRPAAPQSAPSSNPAGTPLAITPQAAANAEPPPRTAPAAAVASAASRATDSGGFVVQLSAQKSEADAQASFRAMQSRYSVLNGQHPLIRRKDQGDRGVFYAAQVGPFGTKDEANQVCESLKSAGGTCFVQKN